MKIKSVEELKKESAEGADFFILLNDGLRSSKHICYEDDEKKFYVLNEIDGSEQRLTERGLFTKSNIGEAIGKGALYKDD